MSYKKPVAYMICGFIGAGKTSFARKLEKETGAIRITKDEWVIRIFGNNITSDNKFEEYDKNISELSREMALNIIKSGKDVIIDEGFWTKPQREEMKRKVIKSGGKTILYYVECPMEVMKKRTINRSQNPPIDSFDINEEMFDKYLKYWQPPTKDENYLHAN